ncbi:MAG: PAS domain-containing sensor histidine kinase [Longimicrobiales bacterium]|nr:PAS domain-containing sensor histidine kinase [Longimicrobiales bacterium]
MPLSSHTYKVVFDSAPDGIMVVDREGTIVEANAHADHLFGYPDGALVGMRVEELVPRDARERHLGHRDDYHADPRRRPMGVESELEALHARGHTFPVEISLSPVEVGEDHHVIAIVRDISDRRRLRNFGLGALRAAEEERTRIARELHDQTAQELATHIVRLTLLERSASAHSEEITALRDGLRETVEGVRRVARGLRPPELEDAGFIPALRAHLRMVSTAHRVRIDLEGESGPDALLDPDGLLALYRIAQEAIANAVRHAGAERIEVRIEVEDERVRLSIRDDGCGFDPASVSDGVAGLGLLGMRERASMIGGTVRIRSGEGGTAVSLEVPVLTSAHVGAPDA